jgi:hypothetical protein
MAKCPSGVGFSLRGFGLDPIPTKANITSSLTYNNPKPHRVMILL